jgi:hypothetical protein
MGGCPSKERMAKERKEWERIVRMQEAATEKKFRKKENILRRRAGMPQLPSLDEQGETAGTATVLGAASEAFNRFLFASAPGNGGGSGAGAKSDQELHLQMT